MKDFTLSKEKQQHLTKIKTHFQTLCKFYIWLGYSKPSQSAYAYQRHNRIDRAFEKLINIYSSIK